MASTEIETLRRKLQSTVSNNLTNTNLNNVLEWCTTFTFIAHLVAYIATLAVLGIVLLLIVRLLGVFEETEDLEPIESDPLRPPKTVLVSYGTVCEEDEEKGNSRSINSGNSSSSSEELYDGRLCVICYDELRDCFFVPCGHCATCYVCADRIFHGENKTCPVCRKLIGKVRRLFASNLGEKL